MPSNESKSYEDRFLQPLQLATSVCIALILSSGISSSAAHYGQPRQTYVPESLIDRRVDVSTLNERNSQNSSDMEAALRHASDTSAVIRHVTPRGNRRPATRYSASSVAAPKLSGEINENGILPPPPPYTAATLSADAKAIQTHLKRIADSPQTAATLAMLKHKAQIMASQGNLDQAKQTAARILQLNPHDKALMKELAKVSADKARIFANSKEFDKAVQYARQSLAFDGTSSDARKMLDNALTKTGVNAGNANERLRMAHGLARESHYEASAVEYRAALNLKPSAEGYVGLGNLAMQANQKDKAKTEFQKAIELEPGSAAAHRQFGVLKYIQGDYVAANSELSRALILDPHDQHAAKSLVELWQRQVSQVPGVNSHLGLARAYQLAGDLNSAQAEYKTVVQLDPNNPHLPACRQSFKLATARQEAAKATEAARTLESQGAYAEAYQKVYEAVDLSPGDADLHVYQGHLLEKLNRFNAAKQAYMNALNIDPGNVLAAARLKALPAQAPPPQAPVYTGAPNFGAPIASATPDQPFTAPAGMPGGAPMLGTPDPVSNLSSFAVALRNHMFVQKNQMQQVEDSAHQMIKAIGNGAPAPSIASALNETAGLAGAGITGAPTPSEEPPLAPTRPLWPGNVGSMLPPPPSVAKPASAMYPVDPGALKPMMPTTASGPDALSSQPSTPLSAPSAVRLELEGANPQATGVDLSVILRNDSDHPLLLPKTIKARIKYSNRRDSEVKPVFEAGLVPSHGQIRGTISVPFDKVDPTADLMIPGLLPQGYPNRDVHLTTSVASR